MRTIYIKPELSALVSKGRVTVADICQVYCYDDALVKEIGGIELLKIEKAEKQKIAMSAMYVVRHISDYKPGVVVVNLGEADFVVEYLPPKPEKKWTEYVKTALVGIVIFFGSAFTMMTFNEDASLVEIFQLVYKNIAGLSESNGWLELSYVVGLPMGILLFFNHFASARLSNDPTPLQIQMRQYEQQEDTTIIENAARKGERLE